MSMFADNPDFYPTPRKLARRMYQKITNKEAKYFLEPSAGKGDIADVIRKPTTYEEFEEEHPEYATKGGGYHFREEDERYERRHVDVIENYPDLISVLRGKSYDVVGFDWLSYEGLSYYDAILMNPPFSQGVQHLLKAWDFLHNGEIVCLLNEETLKNPHTADRQRLAQIIEHFGNVEYLGDAFSTAEHKTKVNVAMVYLKKEAPDDTADLWAKNPSQEKQVEGEFDGDPTMLAIRDNLGNMEHWFNMANEHWVRGVEHIRKATIYMKQNKVTNGSGDNDLAKILEMAMQNAKTSRSEFLRQHRRMAWTSVFHQMEFHRWLDSKQQEKFLRDVQRDSTIPFTAQNIRDTLENVFQSRKRLFEESVASVFDELCSHAVENGSGPVMPDRIKNHHRASEGWKTNDSYKVNQRLIFPYAVELDYGGRTLREKGYGSGSSAVVCADLDRIMCVLDGQSFEKCYTVRRAIEHAAPGQLVESQYFEVRGYKKGTLHLKFKDERLWEKFNITAAAGKKWLGVETERYRPKKRQDGMDADHWECRSGHKFVNGVCTQCKEPEVDEVEAVKCELCRAIFEHTGKLDSCPIHAKHAPALPTTEGQPEPVTKPILALTEGEQGSHNLDAAEAQILDSADTPVEGASVAPESAESESGSDFQLAPPMPVTSPAQPSLFGD